MEQTAAAAIDPPKWPLAGGELARLVADMFAAPLPPDTDERRVFTQNEHGPRPVPGNLVNEPPLKPQHVVKVNRTEQVYLQRPVGSRGGGLYHDGAGEGLQERSTN